MLRYSVFHQEFIGRHMPFILRIILLKFMLTDSGSPPTMAL